MTQYHSVNVKLSNSQLHKLKSYTKHANSVTLRLPSNLTGNDKTNFLHNF